MKILTIFTGGTIGSQIKDGAISPDSESKFKLINEYRKKSEDNETEFDSYEPFNILSENINGKNISILIHAIDDAIRKGNYDGIIVTHGSDTIQYTAAALGIVFKRTTVPVIMVISNYPIGDERSNGVDNFTYAVSCIRNMENVKFKERAGVFLAYKNPGCEPKLFHACALQRHDMYSEEIKELKLDNLTPEIDEDDRMETLFAKSVNLTEHAPVAVISPYPGMRYHHIPSKTKAVLFTSFHSGTIRTESEQLKDVCDYLKRHNIPAYICGVPDGIGYESMKAYDRLGIKVLPKATDVYWYMKLWMELS